MTDTSAPLTPAIERAIRDALMDTYFRGSWAANEDTDRSRSEIADHTRGRFDMCRRWLMPWVKGVIDLAASRVVEVGCGTGSTTAAMAIDAEHVEAYDLDPPSIDAAKRRLDLMGLRNTKLHLFEPNELLEAIARNHAEGSVDVVLCFAVLEHAKHLERLETLKRCWALLRPGGVLVIGDTPNRLTWWDAHTTHLPFLNSVSDELALDYAMRSPRQDFKDAIAYAKGRSQADAIEMLARWGRGVSYHEFELALGPLDDLVVGDGFDPEPMSYYGVSLETRLLYTYAVRKGLKVPPGFLRETLDVILRKPGGAPLPRRKRDLDAIVRPMLDP